MKLEMTIGKYELIFRKKQITEDELKKWIREGMKSFIERNPLPPIQL